MNSLALGSAWRAQRKASAMVLSALVRAGRVGPGVRPRVAGAARAQQAGGAEAPGVVGRADALAEREAAGQRAAEVLLGRARRRGHVKARSEEHTSELQSRPHLVCRLLLE